tara:strand:+ start:1130 stop:1414 length:285 start_codon:yes stop_codon:yes gene_type:complete
MNKDDGGAAFPYGVLRTVREGYGEGERVIEKNEKGMSLRDYFAAAALKGFCANPHAHVGEIDVLQDCGHEGASFEEAANDAYRLADAMLKERKE